MTGTVRHVEVEGEFYGIVADDGTKLDPVNLPEDFRQDGVRVQVRVVEVKDAVSTHMWGKAGPDPRDRAAAAGGGTMI